MYQVRLSNTEAQVRLYEVLNHKIIKVRTKLNILYCTIFILYNIFYNVFFQILDSTERLNDEHSLRAEETLETNTDFLVSVCHFEVNFCTFQFIT